MQKEKMQKVASSNIDAVGYDNGNLFVAFHNGRVYSYEGVPNTEYLELLKAASVGKYFSNNIKPNYSCKESVESQGTQRVVAIKIQYSMTYYPEERLCLTFTYPNEWRTVVINFKEHSEYPEWFSKEVPNSGQLLVSIKDYLKTAPLQGWFMWNGAKLSPVSDVKSEPGTDSGSPADPNKRLREEKAREVFGR